MMISLIFVLVNFLLFIEATPQGGNLIKPRVRYDGSQLWNVRLENEESKNFLSDLEETLDISIWSRKTDEVTVFVKEPAIAGVEKKFKANNVAYTVLVDDMQKLIDEESAAPKPIQNRTDHPMTWDAYHLLDDIFSFLDYLVEKYPNLCSLETIGYSHEKRPLKVLRISNGNPNNKAIWIDGNIHAREWISSASVTYIINDLVENWNDQPDYIQNINFYVLPVHNPDGFEYTHETDRLWRKNRSPAAGILRCQGVDVNRNFGYKWGGKGTSGFTCSEIYKGRNAFSEPESTAVKNFFESTKEKFYGFLTYHSYGQYILYPYGYDSVLTDDHEDLERVGKEAASGMKGLDNEVYQVGNTAMLLYAAAGGSDDYAKSIGIKYSYTIELRDTGRNGFVLPPYLIVPTAKEAREFVFTVARAVAKIQ